MLQEDTNDFQDLIESECYLLSTAIQQKVRFTPASFCTRSSRNKKRCAFITLSTSSVWLAVIQIFSKTFSYGWYRCGRNINFLCANTKVLYENNQTTLHWQNFVSRNHESEPCSSVFSITTRISYIRILLQMVRMSYENICVFWNIFGTEFLCIWPEFAFKKAECCYMMMYPPIKLNSNKYTQ